MILLLISKITQWRSSTKRKLLERIGITHKGQPNNLAVGGATVPEVKRQEPQKGEEGRKGKQKPMMRTVNFHIWQCSLSILIPGENVTLAEFRSKTKLAVPNQEGRISTRGPSMKPCSSHDVRAYRFSHIHRWVFRLSLVVQWPRAPSSRRSRFNPAWSGS